MTGVFSQFQDTTDALPCYSHLPVCLRIMDLHNRGSKKNTCHGNEVLPQDTTHLLTVERDADCSGMDMSPVHQVCQKLSCKPQWKGKEDKADRGKGGKTTSGPGLESAKCRRAVENREKWRKLFVKSSVVPHRPSPLKDRWEWKWKKKVSYLQLAFSCGNEQRLSVPTILQRPW